MLRWPRKAARATAPYGAMLLPVASVTDSACATSEAASANSPANMCTPARMLRAMGSTISAPASRASVTWRSDSTSQLS